MNCEEQKVFTQLSYRMTQSHPSIADNSRPREAKMPSMWVWKTMQVKSSLTFTTATYAPYYHALHVTAPLSELRLSSKLCFLEMHEVSPCNDWYKFISIYLNQKTLRISLFPVLQSSQTCRQSNLEIRTILYQPIHSIIHTQSNTPELLTVHHLSHGM